MRADQLTVELRARNPWEAFDLGIALARRSGANLYLAFMLPYLAFALVVNLVTWGHPVVAMLIVWWSKPAFDRIALHVVSQAVFGATPTWRSTLSGLRQISRTGLAHALTLGRFDFARSFHLAVPQLEGQTGAARRERVRVLDRTVRGPAVWLTIVVMHFAYVLLFGFDGLLRMVSPEGVQFNLQLGDYFGRGGEEPSLTSQYLFNATFVLIECVLEPLYVAAGFALYISRRTVLEGWDLEVAFKRMSARIEAAGALLDKAAVVVLAACMAIAGVGNDALAQSAASGPKAEAAAQATPAATPTAEKKLIEDILKSAEFNEYEERKVWRRKHPQDEEKRAPELSPGWIKFGRFMAEAIRVIAWVLAIVFVGWLLYYLAQRMGWFKDWIGKRTVFKPDVLFGLDLRAESLPDDIPAAARALLASGDVRAALSLLYRGALRVLIHDRHLTVQEGDTEGDCVRRVDRSGPAALAGYFRKLVDAWGLVAYAHRVPDAAAAQSLVDDWAGHFVARETELQP